MAHHQQQKASLTRILVNFDHFEHPPGALVLQFHFPRQIFKAFLHSGP